MNFKSIFFTLICAVFSTFQSIESSICPEFITIYVHGTTTKVGLKLLSKFCKDVTFGKPGIHHFNELPEISLLLKDAKILESSDPKRFDAAHFYTFGWSGSLSFKAREKAGKELYTGVKELLETYKQKYGTIPKLRIWTFSHGGNVALNMVKLLPFFEKEPVHLELLLIAVPVQKVTEKLIEHPCIAQSYVISSTRDLMQVLDTYKFEKKRYTPTRFFDTMAQNCRQIKVLVNNRGLGHADLLRSFTVHLPSTLQSADQAASCKIMLLPEVFGQKVAEQEKPNIFVYAIQDPQFRFFNFLNIKSCVRGKRKKLKKIMKHQYVGENLSCVQASSRLCRTCPVLKI